jgi:LysM repeat protein
MPSVTLSLPVMIGLLIVILGAGGGGVFLFTRPTPPPAAGATPPTLTATITPTVTITGTATATGTPLPPTLTPTPLVYTVKTNDNCGKIAFSFNVSINSIIQLNPALNSDCTNMSIGQKLLIPVPTSTPLPAATSTPNPSQVADSSCEIYQYTVKDGDTLGGISANFNVPSQAIKDWNGLTSDIVFSGMPLKIPTCKRYPTAGPTPTATPPPPYAAPNLLLPADGATFISGGDVITLQWSSVGSLRQNEFYAVTIDDLTDSNVAKLVDYVTDTKYIVPTTLRPSGTSPHIFRWTITPVRQTGSTKDGQAVYEPGGDISTPRVFGWAGSGGVPAVTPTP